LSAVGAPCNTQPGTLEAVFDRCDQPGDRFRLDNGSVAQRDLEIGHIENVPGEPLGDDVPIADDTPGLHIYLADPLVTERDAIYGPGQCVRTFVSTAALVEDLAYFTFTTRWAVLEGGLHIFGRVQTSQFDDATRLLAVGVVEGDKNRNGVYGAREARPVSLLVPGDPEQSYLIARLRGFMMEDEVPGSRMPLANQPLSTTKMLALFCVARPCPATCRRCVSIGRSTTPTATTSRIRST
jgi:hypothetical protein